METIETWDTDGTFKLLIIHSIVASKLVPVVCCYVRVKILANKTLINKAAALRVSLYPQTEISHVVRCFIICTAQLPDDDRTVRFTLTNLIQMWCQTLNQDAFLRTHTVIYWLSICSLVWKLEKEMPVYKLIYTGKRRKCWGIQKYVLNVQHVFLDKEGCCGAVWTDLEVPAGIDRKDQVENCQVNEHMAYVG
ncbi:hypothetical protein T12_6507 [Trichinella patagoniensis]|uniref:Uncharacterized protein n=1 Tax=Trichinella patagoniensis TaxID=990121 RepID=A0A0V1A645_9BILA|nr:hypothetical protein T12_6507 [Trichinella patagoniensis]